MGLGNHFIFCDICGAPGHKARNCGVHALEQRKDPFGEELRRHAYRERRRKRESRGAPGNVQSSRTIGL